MLDFLDNNTANIAVQFISYFIIAFAGAFLKEVHKANTVENYEFTAYKVIYGTLIAIPLTFIISKYYFNEELDWIAVGFISLVLGFIGYELFVKLSTISGIKSLISDVKSTNEEIQETVDKKDNNNEEPVKDEDTDLLDHKYVPDITAKKHKKD